jgi:glycosyl transferase family 25
MPFKKIKITIKPLLFLLIIITTCIIIYIYIAPVKIIDTHVINMDKSKDRWEEIKVSARNANLPIKRWKAIDGSKITESDIRRYNLSALIYSHTRDKKQPGVLGCFLSHKTLLKHLEGQWNLPWHAHLILEDDAYIPSDFWKQWNDFSRDLPSNWDIVQIGVTEPRLKRISGDSQIYIHSEEDGNVGAFAYLVKHSSLSKINKHLEYMYDPIDTMIRNKQNEWNIYFAWPEICPHNDHGKSTIVAQRH